MAPSPMPYVFITVYILPFTITVNYFVMKKKNQETFFLRCPQLVYLELSATVTVFCISVAQSGSHQLCAATEYEFITTDLHLNGNCHSWVVTAVLDSVSVGRSIRAFILIVLPLFCSVGHCSNKSIFKKKSILKLHEKYKDFPGGPVVKNPPSNARDVGLIPGWGTKIPHAKITQATKPVCLTKDLAQPNF